MNRIFKTKYRVKLEFKEFIYATKICEQAADSCRVIIYVFIHDNFQITASRTFVLPTHSITYQ